MKLFSPSDILSLMEPLQNLKKIRLDKLEKIKAAGINPYPAKFDRIPISEARNKNLDEEVRVAGRLMALRGHGKLIFADLTDASGKIQLAFKIDLLGEEKMKFLDLLDLGDFLGAAGKLTKTQAGELTVMVSGFTLLTKSLTPLPSSWYGLKDVEERFRKRYLDLIMNGESKNVFEIRSKVVAAVREFFNNRGFLEVETPTLQPIYGGANARPFKTHHNALDFDLYLKISDELYLKRLIVGGFDKVYEIDKDFRNEGMDKTHNPEFTMMECYEAYADYKDMMEITEHLYEYVAQKVLGTTKIKFGETEIELKAPWKRLTMKDALKEYAGLDVDRLSDEDLKNEIKKHNLKYEGNPSLTGVGEGFKRGIAVATLFEIVEPKLIQPTFVYDFPKETTALCKPKADDPKLIERFEPYINGWEIGNAYSELNDPQVQKEFFEDQQKAKASGDEEAHPMDTDYVEALEYGMPPTGGLGLGIDRMVMFMANQPTIRDVILFPTMKSVDKTQNSNVKSQNQT